MNEAEILELRDWFEREHDLDFELAKRLAESLDREGYGPYHTEESEESYADGYESGYEDGRQEGYDEGYSTGYDEGLEEGSDD